MRIDLCRPTAEERRSEMAGDDLIPSPMATIDLAITIAARPADIWPWLVQMGSGRAGWYSYDHIDNGGVPSARSIRSELQDLSAGDIMPWLPGATDGFVVAELIPECALVLLVPLDPALPGAKPARATSALLIEPLGRASSRLRARGRVSRDWLTMPVRQDQSGKPAAIERVYALLAKMPASLMRPVASFGHYLFQSRELRGIKQRAERHGA